MNKVFSFMVMAFLGCGSVSAQQVNASGVQRPKLEAMRNKEMWQAGVTVRKLRPENN